MIFEHQRWEIWNALQHPFKHSLTDFAFSNPALPGVTNVESALNYILAVLYPQTQAAVANPAALPLAGNTLNDMRVVIDDGDGKSAAYRWEQREGEGSPSWHKIYDMDFGVDSIMEHFQNVTQDIYVVQRGKRDRDAAGNFIVGTYAGQTIWGGTVTGENLTFNANSADGTGYVQTDNTFRPTSDNAYDLGTATERWRTGYFSTSLIVDTLSLAPGLITDSSGSISFGDENLTTTGYIISLSGYFSSSVEVGPFAGNALILAAGSITDESGAISFGDENLSTTGTLAAGVTTLTDNAQTLIFSPDVAGKGQITSSTGTISFDNENLETTGNFLVGVLNASQVNVDAILRLDGNLISILTANTDLALVANGTGIIDLQSNVEAPQLTVTGDSYLQSLVYVGNNLTIQGGVTSSVSATNGNHLLLETSGGGFIQFSTKLYPTTDNALDIGQIANRVKDFYLSGTISDGTTAITQATLQSLRDINSGVAPGYTIFWDGTKWVSSAPDTEVDHGTISGLADDDHTQYLLLAGRAGGQVVIGGTGVGDDLVFESTSNATKGYIQFKDTTAPFTNASYSGGWSGTDLGASDAYWKDVYTKGEFFGLRFQNTTSGALPAASAQNIGRVVFATDNNKAYVDIGTAFKVLGVSKFVEDTVWNGSDTTKDVDVSADIEDARNAIWQLKDNTNDFEILGAKLKATSASNVRIEVSPALPAGSYRLIGVE